MEAYKNSLVFWKKKAEILCILITKNRIRILLNLILTRKFRQLYERSIKFMVQNHLISERPSLIEPIEIKKLEKNEVLISVIIPCYNYGKFINQAIDSVIKQSIKVDEIIVVDGGSNDEYTLEVLKKIDNKNLKVFFRNERCLVGNNRNFGINIAKGRYICCLDADDFLDPTYIEKAIFYMEFYGYDIVSCALKYIGLKTGIEKVLSRPDLDDMINANHILTCAIFRKKDWAAVNGFKDWGLNENHIAEDWDFWIRLMAYGARVFNMENDPMLNYRIHSAPSLSRSSGIKSLKEQGDFISKTNMNILTKEAFRNSRIQAKKNFKAQYSFDNLSENFPITSGQRTLLIALPYSIVGGAERLLSGLCKYLCKNGWRVLIVTTLSHDHFGNTLDWFKDSTNEIFTLTTFTTKDTSLQFLLHLIISRRVDCLINAGSLFIYENSKLIKNKFPNLALVDILFNLIGHTSSHLEYRNNFSYALSESNEVYNWYKNIAGWSTDRISLVKSCVDIALYKPRARPHDIKSKYNIKDHEIVVGYSGRLSEEKGPADFLQVVKLCKDNHNLRFIMTGNGPMYDTIIALIQELELGDRLDFAGPVDNIDDYFATYDILVVPSRIDGRPFAVMEALACGVPVIASDIGGIPDLIEDGINGFLVQPEDVQNIASILNELTADIKKLKILQSGARDSALNKFDVSLSYRHYELALLQAIQASRVESAIKTS